MMAVAPGFKLTVTGEVSWLPSLPLKVTGMVAVTPLVFEKYRAVYHPPPKATCGNANVVTEPESAVRWFTAMDVNAEFPERNPRTDTAPLGTEKLAHPRLPAAPVSPGMFLRIRACFDRGPSITWLVPISEPSAPRSFTPTVV